MANVAPEFKPPKWKCHSDAIIETPSESIRHLLEGDHHHRGEIEHQHDHHSDHNHNHNHNHDHSDNPTMEHVFSHIKDSLRGSSVRFGEHRRLSGHDYTFEVDVFIEVDQTLVDSQGGQTQTINYINSLVTGANTVFEVS